MCYNILMRSPIKAVSYLRCSVVLAQSPSHQREPIKQLAEGRGFDLIDEYVDLISGTKEKRKELDRLRRDAQRGKFKVIIIYALDRLARDVRFLLNLLHEMDTYGVRIISIRESLDFSSDNPISRALVQIIGAVAELERNLISERIKTALAVKKQLSQEKGIYWRTGRPSKAQKMSIHILKLREKGLSIRKIAKQLNLSPSSVARVLKKD